MGLKGLGDRWGIADGGSRGEMESFWIGHEGEIGSGAARSPTMKESLNRRSQRRKT